jgi:hypothetical protein
MIRNIIAASLIVTLTANSCFAGRNLHKRERKTRAEAAARIGNKFNFWFDSEKPTQLPKDPVRVRSYVKNFQDLTSDELETLMPILVEALNDHLLGRIDLTR